MSEKNSWLREACGVVASVASFPVALVAGTVSGVVRAVEDESWTGFGEAFEKTGSAVFDGAEELGKEFGPQVIIGVTIAATTALTGKTTTRKGA